MPVVSSESHARPWHKPDMSEFNIVKTALGDGDTETIEKINGPSVLFVISGSGNLIAEAKSYELKKGYMFCYWPRN